MKFSGPTHRILYAPRQFDRAHARELLTTSLRLSRYDAQADIELGLQYEGDEDFGRAEKQLLEAYKVNHTYLVDPEKADFKRAALSSSSQ